MEVKMNQNGKLVTQQIEKLSNFRDIGGLKTSDGNFMKSGVLFRSDELSRVTDKDISILQTLNIKVICDLRTPNECNKKQAPLLLKQGINTINIPFHDQETHNINWKQLTKFLFSKSGATEFKEFSRSYYQHLAFERTSQIKEIITSLSYERNLPALVHCTAGKDRTGYISALIQLLVGIPYETVILEYLMTNRFYESRMEKLIKVMKWITLFQVSTERIKLILMADREVLDGVYDNIIRRYGSVETYLCEACEINQTMILKLKNMLLE
jgi:protein-tyrosine phosphatase